MEVFKFGGLSTADASSVKRVVSIISDHLHLHPVLVFSAMGKTTRLLERLAFSAFHHQNEWHALYNEFVSFHNHIIADLGIEMQPHCEQLYHDLEMVCASLHTESYDFFYDQVVAFGELAASRIMSDYLSSRGVENCWTDIREYIKAKPPYREAQVDFEGSCNLLKRLFNQCAQDKLIVTQGFLAGAADGSTITLGLDGSDYTAAIIASCMGISPLTIWKDVKGVLNADPRYFSNAETLPELTYAEAVEQSFYGATVIHPRTIKPLENNNIELKVKSFLYPEAAGTIIGNYTSTDSRPVIYILKKNQLMLTFISRDFSFIMEDSISEIFSVLCSLHIRANLMQNSAISFTVCVDHTSVAEEMEKYLGRSFQVSVVKGVELLTLRNYNEQAVKEVLLNKKVLLKMLSNQVAQFVVESEE